MDLDKLAKILSENNQPKFRLGQIKKAIYQDGVSSFQEITTLSKELREELNKKIKILSFTPNKILTAKNKQSVKAALRLEDGNIIETVLLSPLPSSWSVCISTQVGCPLNCAFCATGRGGFKRNLITEEITDQILFWKQYMKAENEKLKTKNYISNVVYMGMGELFLNWENVKQSLKELTDAKLFGFGSRSISVSTCGIPDGILKFVQEFPQINLAVSLHFADDDKRSRYMPINKKYNLEKIKEALQKYFQISNRKVFLEYIMLAGINDNLEDAKKLADYIKSIGKLQLLHVNLIKYNATGNEFKSSSGNKIQTFKNFLERNRINVTIRKSLGEEIQGACGQLAGK
ncbi:MAG: 23S rRNA (adenine(2503)-C(2))-methyltransferase RlmN [Candidatus Moranbacteria bacterium]|nr:23S rRNA (adenine(2503)-C(2))-methyltransferase RlmN [Candidatus Moranbacteria bacterium]